MMTPTPQPPRDTGGVDYKEGGGLSTDGMCGIGLFFAMLFVLWWYLGWI